jgi:hypothetical protein
MNEDDEFMQVLSVADSYGSDDNDDYNSIDEDKKSPEEVDFEPQFR